MSFVTPPQPPLKEEIFFKAWNFRYKGREKIKERKKEEDGGGKPQSLYSLTLKTHTKKRSILCSCPVPTHPSPPTMLLNTGFFCPSPPLVVRAEPSKQCPPRPHSQYYVLATTLVSPWFFVSQIFFFEPPLSLTRTLVF